MSHKSIHHISDLLEMELNDTPILDQAELWLSLHSQDPGPEGDQATFEIKYEPYARVRAMRVNGEGKLWKIDIARTSSGTVSSISAHNLRDIIWPTCDRGVARAKWFGLGTTPSGSGKLLRRGPIIKPEDGLIINPGTAPKASKGTIKFIDL